MGSKKLYRVTLCGRVSSYWKDAYVIAEDAGEAYRKVRQFLDHEDIGFQRDRELYSVCLIAEDVACPDCGAILFP